MMVQEQMKEQMEQLQKALMHEVSHRRSLQEQYRLQEEKLMKSLEQAEQVPSQSQSPKAKPPAMEPSMTSLPPSLQEARNVQALNEKLQRKDDVIKAKKTQIKMLLADNERMLDPPAQRQRLLDFARNFRCWSTTRRLRWE